ncbi:hypothetical protein TL16_g03837 [Triparma laevis f. inornata]|uniref:Uncharacterized protein n=1 Tax=Triparma laevis f. inornata TaxID=1714386 RepID=A0A9W7A0Z2_9STRA|nr:hypothetical protein TL16_g03837 [Triparma laevis f. inornata]
MEVSNKDVVSNDKMLAMLPEHCTDSAKDLQFGTQQIYAQDAHLQNTAGLWTNFTGDWIVPPLPSSHDGQVDYHWTGFKSSQPEMGYPVLQPVLQYGQTMQAKWQLQSWYVWGNGGKAVTGPAVDINEGDKLTTYMSFDDDSQTWTVYGKNEASGEESILTITKDALGCDCDFEWAMIVHETIGKKTGYCDDYPADSSGITYTNTRLDGEAVDWTTRVQKTECGEAVNVEDDKVEFTWKN